MSNRRTRRNFTEAFKKQMVQLYLNGKASSEIIKEYDLTPSGLPKWINQFNNTGSFNRTKKKKSTT